MNIGVAGLGVVGSALAQYLECDQHTILRYDPAKGYNDDLSDCRHIFICVSAPTVLSDWPVDTSNIEDVIRRFGTAPKYFVRSTVVPGTTRRLRRQFGSEYSIFSMPEFVSEKTALYDMQTMPIITDFPSMVDLGSIFCQEPLLWQKIVMLGTAEECELAKYAHNVFGALKVTFFNVIAGACEAEGVNYRDVLDAVLRVGHMDPQYTKVPGPDGQYGFGGTCFPKDTLAFMSYLRSLEKDIYNLNKGSALVEEILEYNESVRRS